MPISTREQLKDHIHSIHDYLRNSGAGYGMTAMKIFSFFYGLKKIENLKLDTKICKFSNLIKIIDGETDEETYDETDDETADFPTKLKINERVQKILKAILTADPTISYYVHHYLPLNLKDDIWIDIIKMVDDIPTIIDKDYNENLNLSGKVYEYFIGRDASAISELGAYFTDRYITNHIINKVNPISTNGIIKSMIDPFGGSGGFTLGYVEYFKKNTIVWLAKDSNHIENYKKINHCDMNEDVIKIAGLEFFTFTDNFPNKPQFYCDNAFKRDFKDKYDYIFTNPPYGGDKTEKSPEVINNDKILGHIKPILDELNDQYIKNKQYSDIINKIQIKGKHKPNIIQYTCDELPQIYDALLKMSKPNNEENDAPSAELIELICDVKVIVQQITDLKKANKEHATKREEKQVNYGTCSKFIQNYIKDNEITGCNDKEACSLVLFMALLQKNGTCARVLKEGVFFDNKYASIRGHLLKKFNVKYVISIGSDQFENTTTKTSALIFENTESIETNEVIFYDLLTEKEEEDVYVKLPDRTYELTKRKDDIIRVFEKETARATIKDICAPTIIKDKKGKEIEKYYYSLNAKKYNVVKVECSDKYKLVKIGDICSFGEKSNHKAKGDHVKKDGKYNFYTSSETIKKCDFADYEDIYIMIGTGGNSCIHIDSMFSCSSDMILLKPLIDPMYMYYILTISMNRIINNMHGSTIKHVTKCMLVEFQIPIPKSPELLNKWVKKISLPYNTIQKKKKELEELEQWVKTEVKRIGDDEKCDMVALGELCEYIKTGKNKTPDDKKGTKYPYYGTASITGYTDHYLFDGEHLLVARNGTMGNIFYTNNRIYPSDHIFAIKNKKEYHIRYMYYQILNKANDIDKISNGSTIKGINIHDLEKIKIPIPRNKQLIKSLESKFTQIEKLQEEIKTNEQEYDSVLMELSKDINPPITCIDDNKNENDNVNDDTNYNENNNDNDKSNDIKTPIKKKITKIKIDDEIDEKSIKNKTTSANPTNSKKIIIVKKKKQRIDILNL